MKKKIIVSFSIILVIVSGILYYLKSSDLKKEENLNKIEAEELKKFSSNIIENVKYSTKDINGNEYIITAKVGEIDINNNEVIFLKKVNGTINLSDNNSINIYSEFGKYNINNFDTIFSKNVIINYLDNKIEGQYLDFSIQRNSMIISKNVILTNLNNTIKTDVVEINIKTKDIKVYMYDKNKKVSIERKN